MRGRWGVRSAVTASASTITRVTAGEYGTATVTPLQPWHSGHTDGAAGRVWLIGLSSAQPSGHATRSSAETVASNTIRSAANSLLTTTQVYGSGAPVSCHQGYGAGGGDRPTFSQEEPRCPNSAPGCRCSRCPRPASTTRSARADRHEALCPHPALLLHLGRDGPTLSTQSARTRYRLKCGGWLR